MAIKNSNGMQLRTPIKLSLLVIGIVVITLASKVIFFSNSKSETPKKMSYYADIINDTKNNTNFRQVLFTGQNSQLVVMSIPPGGEIGEEIHKYTEQTLFFLSGIGEGMLEDKKFPIGPGLVVVVTPGTKHNFLNTGTRDLKIYTVYSPPNHIDGRVHTTKADADADTANEAFGESAPSK